MTDSKKPKEIPGAFLTDGGDVFNGEYTIWGPYGHRTVSLETQGPDEEFAPGKRVLYLLTGPDDWKAFAFVGRGRDGIDPPKVSIFKRYRSARGEERTHFELIAVLFMDMVVRGRRQFRSAKDGQLHDYKLMASSTCRICNRRLTEPTSIVTGIGPVCAGRVGGR